MKNQQGAPEALRPIARYKIGYHTDEWGMRSSTPGGVSDPAGQWVRYDDHIAALASAAAPVVQPGIQVTRVELTPEQRESLRVKNPVFIPGVGASRGQAPAGADYEPYTGQEKLSVEGSQEFARATAAGRARLEGKP